METNRRNALMAATLTVCMACGCAQLPGTNQQQGAVAGAAAGGLLGHELGGGALGTLLGAVAGGALGYNIGNRLGPQDRQQTAFALEKNRQVSWKNPDTGYDYTVDPTNTYTRNGQTCRDFTMRMRVESGYQNMHGTACRQPDGNWQIVQS